MNKNVLYLDLLKRCLVNTIYSDYEYFEIVPYYEHFEVMPYNKTKRFFFQKLFMPLLRKILRKSNAKVIIPYNYDENKRTLGLDWPPMAHTMIGLKRLDNLQYCVEEVIKNNIPGDLIETGIWRGGATIFMRAILKAYGVTDRKVWVADSFEGLPKADEEKYPQDKGDMHHTNKYLAVSMEQVKQNFQKYGLLDKQVYFLKGWFKDTLPNAPIQKLAVVRLDGDIYESTMDALKNLYHKLSVGGFIIIDDYSLKGTKAAVAVHDFRKERGINEEIIVIEGAGAYWQKL